VYAEAYKQRYLIARKYVQGEKVAGPRVLRQTEAPSLSIKQEFRLIAGYIVSISTIRDDDTQPTDTAMARAANTPTVRLDLSLGSFAAGVETEERVSTSKSC